MDIKQILLALTAVLTAVEGGKPLNSVANDINDAAGLLAALNAAGVNVGSGILELVTKSAASEHNLEAGQAALVATVGASFNGQEDKVVIVAVRQSSELAKQLLGL